MFRDSFGGSLIAFLSLHFRQAVIYTAYTMEPDLIEKVHPDVVLTEMVERRLNTEVPQDPTEGLNRFDQCREQNNCNLEEDALQKPFGTLDTPRPGQTISGEHYLNFGWAVAPQPNVIPFDGLTIDVLVDGVSLGHPAYGDYRADVAAEHPNLRNSNHAVGHFELDTTRLNNGEHTIAWQVSDLAGRQSLLGYRKFFVNNPK
jgi:hypothetical protein